MAEESDPEVDAAVLAIIGETVGNVRKAVAGMTSENAGLSDREALERLHGNLSEAMRVAAEQDPDAADEVRFAYLVLDLAFKTVRRALGN
ncbi:MAG: hypothetical protein IT405_02485 [Candidatus Yanofskybacteria bacterium]|nr:hypothetical protein [Candidatus Yanofskybacteria bacterium]